jgi:hypothetical protein
MEEVDHRCNYNRAVTSELSLTPIPRNHPDSITDVPKDVPKNVPKNVPKIKMTSRNPLAD